jgi:hypothetical protein
MCILVDDYPWIKAAVSFRRRCSEDEHLTDSPFHGQAGMPNCYTCQFVSGVNVALRCVALGWLVSGFVWVAGVGV